MTDKKNSYYFILGIIFISVLLAITFSYSEFEKQIAVPQSQLTFKRTQTTITAVGDIMLSRHVNTRIDEENDPSLPYRAVNSLLNKTDILFGNLECPLDNSGIPIREGLVFRCLTENVVGLKQAGFNVLSTANNHSFDQGEDNLRFTVEYLQNQEILPVGTGLSFSDAHNGETIEKNGVKFGFLAYSYTAKNDGGQSKHNLIATMDNPEQLQSDILNLKSRSDVVIVSMHAGTEYVTNPTQQQINFARTAIDTGADVVIGHHPHWIQTIEIYKNKPIFYSLGNFIFDQEWSRETREGLAVKLQFANNKLQTAELIPVIIEDFCCPRPATDEEKQKILKRIGQDTENIEF